MSNSFQFLPGIFTGTRCPWSICYHGLYGVMLHSEYKVQSTGLDNSFDSYHVIFFY